MSVDLLRLDRNFGPAGARNAGLVEVRTPLVAFVDSDVDLTRDALTKLASCFADPNVGLVAPWVRGRLPVAGRHSWIARYDADRSSLDLGAEAGTVRPRASVAWLPAACLLARTDALGNGFDPAMRVGEDVDLVWRMVHEGRRVLYVADVQVFHEARTTAWDVLHRKLVYGTSAGDLARRHGTDVAPAVLAPWSVAVVATLVMQRRWSLPACAVIAGVTAERIRRRLPAAQHRGSVAATLAFHGILAATAQTGNLGLRHWWPLGALAAPISGASPVPDRRHRARRRRRTPARSVPAAPGLVPSRQTVGRSRLRHWSQDRRRPRPRMDGPAAPPPRGAKTLAGALEPVMGAPISCTPWQCLGMGAALLHATDLGSAPRFW